MSSEINITVLELLSSKICHDLISPVGAVANGVEFLEEMGADAGQDVTDLIAYSAKQSSSKLQAFRMAYGAGGADSGIKPEDVHKILGGLIELDGKVTQNWDPYAPIGPEYERPPALGKILMLCFLTCIEALPKGGEITATPEGTEMLTITAKGSDAGLKPLSLKTLQGDMAIDGLDPKLVHGYMVNHAASTYGYGITCTSNENDMFSLNLQLPA